MGKYVKNVTSDDKRQQQNSRLFLVQEAFEQKRLLVTFFSYVKHLVYVDRRPEKVDLLNLIFA